MKKYFLLLFFYCCFTVLTYGQEKFNKDSMANTPVKSTLSYEALTQFFQSSLSTGKKGGFDFKSSLFGIEKLFSKKDLDLSDYYLRQKVQRNLEFALGVHKDDDGNLNTILAGFKYALINKRSKSDINFLEIPEINTSVKNMGNALSKALVLAQAGINSQTNPAIKKKKQQEFDNGLKKYTASQKIKDLPDGMEKILDSLIRADYKTDPAVFFGLPQRSYDKAAKQIDLGSLLTLGFSPGYNWSGRRWDSSTVYIQYLKGFGNYIKPWNIDAQLKNHFLHDTSGTAKNLSRSIAVISLGVNKILVNDDQLNPLIEFELAFEDDYVHQGRYISEDKNKLLLNTILRVHITKELSVPVTLQFDLKHSNLLGFLKVDWNLENNKKR